MIRKLLPAVLAGSVLLFAACGDDDSGSASQDAAGNGTDRALITEMREQLAS